jgi:hypothetical protein
MKIDLLNQTRSNPKASTSIAQILRLFFVHISTAHLNSLRIIRESRCIDISADSLTSQIIKAGPFPTLPE